jgi:hypothetical protein
MSKSNTFAQKGDSQVSEIKYKLKLDRKFKPLNFISQIKIIKFRQRIRNTDGQQLAFSLEKEKEIYFNQLTLSWNNSAFP